MILKNHPFHIGATQQPTNANGLPDTYQFELLFDSHRGLLYQPPNEELVQILHNGYMLGQAFGTPLAEDQFGKPYAEDFLAFIKAVSTETGQGLEIGAGVGYLSRRLLDAGWDMTSLEPGLGYEPFWSKYNIEVIREFFPSDRATGPYQLICSYGVLEHIATPLEFLTEIKKHLELDGFFVFSVPDCTEEIEKGDPSILFHEHFNYFEEDSLLRLFELVGMNVHITKSRFGRCLYGVARVGNPGIEKIQHAQNGFSNVATYTERCQNFIRGAKVSLSEMTSKGTLGVYCAARGLALLDGSHPMRFFDDDRRLQGKYFPPFQPHIESRVGLADKPVDFLVIMSRTFGESIRNTLRSQGYSGTIVTVDEL
jgi:hypothetical protein